ncbi:hypothetical protein KKF82_07250 [Patescibacteria group bacterium]|nr:hypothetical protein [Patescibacteria group bacterium]
MGELQKLGLGEKITVKTLPGRGGKPIGRLPDGRVILFDQNSPYFDMLATGQSVECHVIVISENYVIVSPIREPEEAVIVHYLEDDFPEVDVDDIIKDLEKMIKNVKGKNAEVIPKALLHVIRLEQLIIKILKGEV